MKKRIMRWFGRGSPARHGRGLFARLRADTRGNTLAIMAAALVPLAGMVGGGIDISRMYIAKTRMQHACDAGALAGRKAMGGGTWAQSSYYPRTSAEKFFDSNFQSGGYGTQPVTRSFTESGGTVTGTASLTIPMTLMRILGKTTDTLAVTCEAEMRLPNTDVMFVLDTTGSMASKATATSTQTKIEDLKDAVKCFYEIVARNNTDAVCDGGDPSGGTNDDTQVRFGFVPYSTNVNVGRLLNTSWVADSWDYQTRKEDGFNGSWSAWSYDSAYYPVGGACPKPANTTTVEYQAQIIVYNNVSYCYLTIREKTKWDYARRSLNVSGLKSGSSWNASLTMPVGPGGTNRTFAWDGCIEERQTVKQLSYNPIPANAYDLQIDMLPTGNNATKWGPALPNLIFARKVPNDPITLDTTKLDATDVNNGIENYFSYGNYTPIAGLNGYYACPTPARNLQVWPTASAFETYVDSLNPVGNTYHDIGMLWGARLMSPTGLFAAQNALTPQGGEIERHMIFMTDGDTVTNALNYAAYGIPYFDRRQTSSATVPTDAELDAQVDARFDALCTAVKNKNITLWVISFGEGTNTATDTRLAACASTGKYFSALNSSALQTSFRSIAEQITQLRLTR
ncbi:MAG: pilus assembly protein TadG-related protein [Pseudomonadota bacterium]